MAEYASMAPCEIVPALADEGIYIASESTFYRVLMTMMAFGLYSMTSLITASTADVSKCWVWLS